MKSVDRIWFGIKLLLSAMLVVIAAMGVFAAAESGKIVDPAVLGLVAFSIFLAALPWVSMEKPSRAFGLVGLVMTLGIFYVAYDTFVGNTSFPKDCSPSQHTVRGQLACNTFNAIYNYGGTKAVGSVWLVFGVVMFTAALKILARSHRVAQQGAQDRRAEDSARLN